MSESSIGRAIGVLTSPGKTFTSIRERPTWIVALLVIILLGVGSYYLLSQRMDMGEIVRDSIAQRGQEVSEDQMEAAIDFYEKFGVIFSFAMIIIGTPIFYLIGTLVIWVAAKLVGAELSFKQNWSTFIHAQMPHAVAAVLSVPAILSREEFGFDDVKTGSILPSNLGAFAPQEASAAMVSLLSSIDVFSLWALVLLILGVSTVGRAKRGTVAVAVGGCWLVYVLGKAGWAAIFG